MGDDQVGISSRSVRQISFKVPDLEPDVFVRVDPSGVTLSGRYLVEASLRRQVASDLWRVVVKAINDEPTVTFAYPTMRTYFESPIEVTNT